jgi:peptide subunit release factor 1 (eRF1)
MSLVTTEFMDNAVNQRNAATRQQVLSALRSTVFRLTMAAVFDPQGLVAKTRP